MVLGLAHRTAPTTPTEPPSLDITLLQNPVLPVETASIKRMWLPKAGGVKRGSQHRRTSDKSDKSQQSAKSSKSGKSAKSDKSNSSKASRKLSKLQRLPPVDLSLPLSKLSEALDLAPLSLASPTTKERRATKAALALRTLILDPPAFSAPPTVSLAAIPPSPLPTPTSTTQPSKGIKGRKSSAQIPQLREKDVDRLRTQLLKPDEAKMVIASARALHISKPNAAVERAVCLDCSEFQADQLIVEAKRIEAVRVQKERHLDNHRFSTLKAKSAPPPPPRLPVLLSLFAEVGASAGRAVPADPTIMTLGLFEPASAMSLHRPLAGALPSADTLRRGFDALINAESKIYLYEGPSHKDIHPPTDRISVYTYWWGFELALPPPTLEYLGRAKSIATSILNLLSVIVYAVPGGTRELAPFVGVLSRYIENEWVLLKSQDRGKGVVCGATWFIPAALTARPWDFGEETIRDHPDFPGSEIETNPDSIGISPIAGDAPGETGPGTGPTLIPKEAVVKISGPKGEAEGVVLGVGRGIFGEGVNEGRTAPPNQVGSEERSGAGWKRKDNQQIEIALPKPLPSGSETIGGKEHATFNTDPSHELPPPMLMMFARPPIPAAQVGSAPERPKTKRSPSLLSTSRFKLSKKKKGKPTPIDAIKANLGSAGSAGDSPSTMTDSTVPTPSASPTTPSSALPAIFTHTLTSRTIRLIRGTIIRKPRSLRKKNAWNGVESSEADSKEKETSTIDSAEGTERAAKRRRASAFEIRRFYSRSM